MDERMKILHIAQIENKPWLGTVAVIPKHVKHQSEFADIGFLNVSNIIFDAVKKQQIIFKSPFDVTKLPKPFNSPDLVVFHEVYKPEYLKIAKNLRKHKVPYIIMPHGSLTKEAQKKKHLKKLAANFLFFNRFIRGAEAIQYLSEREANTTCFNNRKLIGTNGTDMPKERKKSFNTDKLRFTYIGRWDCYHKGLDLMVRAIARKKDVLIKSGCTFEIYGPDQFGEGDKLRQLIQENGIADLVFLKTGVFAEEKKKVLLDSDVFIQTSRFEGMPMGILEALSYGIPVLITQGTTLGDLVERYNAGWVAETSVESIADALEKLVDERNGLAERSRGAIALVQDNFEWNKIAFDTIEKYKREVE